MATHSSILAWKILRTKEPGRLQSMGSQRVDMTEQFWGRGVGGVCVKDGFYGYDESLPHSTGNPA